MKKNIIDQLMVFISDNSKVGSRWLKQDVEQLHRVRQKLFNTTDFHLISTSCMDKEDMSYHTNLNQLHLTGLLVSTALLILSLVIFTSFPRWGNVNDKNQQFNDRNVNDENKQLL